MRLPTRANKYGARKREYRGVVYDSIKEANYAAELHLRVLAKDILCWERQITIPIDVNGMPVCNVVVDFLITHNDGSMELVEVKGFETPVFKLKLKLLRATFLHENPEFTYTVV